MSGTIILNFDLEELFGAIQAILTIAILLYVARLPNKGRYYIPFMLYCAVSTGFALINVFENTGVTIQDAFRASEFTGLMGPPGMFALQYYFVLNFATDRKNSFQKYTLVGAIGYWLIFGTLGALGLKYTKPVYGTFTATGYDTPASTAAWTKYLVTPVVPVINLAFNYDYLAITLLSLYALLSYFRSSKSSLVKSQVSYLVAGVILDWFAVTWHQFTIQHGSPLYDAPDIQIPLYCATLIVLLTGLTRHQFRKVTPVAETAVVIPQTYVLAEGRSYLSRDNDSCFAAFGELVRNGREGLCVARIFPDDVRRTYGLQTTPIRWISEEKGEDAISATDLLGLSLTVKDFMEKAKKPVVMLQGIEYLARVNGFTPVIRLLDGLYEAAGKKNGIILIPVSPNALEPREDAILVSETTPQPAPSRS